MKAIITKYISATNTKPGRIKAMAEGVKPLIMSYSAADNDGGSVEDAHRAAAGALRDRQNWKGELVGGGLPDQTGYCFCFAPGAAAAAPVPPAPNK